MDGRRDIATRPDGSLQLIPEAPLEGGTVENAVNVVINDHGMVARTLWMKRAITPDNPFGNPTPENWFYDGQKWIAMKMPASGVLVVGHESINAKGLVAAKTFSDTRHLWRPEKPEEFVTLPGAGTFGETLVINDAGVVGGGIIVEGDVNARSKATIWIDGQPVDLNTVTSVLPRGWMLQMVKAINNKGQLLVNAVDTTRSGNDSIKTVLLTPR